MKATAVCLRVMKLQRKSTPRPIPDGVRSSNSRGMAVFHLKSSIRRAVKWRDKFSYSFNYQLFLWWLTTARGMSDQQRALRTLSECWKETKFVWLSAAEWLKIGLRNRKKIRRGTKKWALDELERVLQVTHVPATTPLQSRKRSKGGKKNKRVRELASKKCTRSNGSHKESVVKGSMPRPAFMCRACHRQLARFNRGLYANRGDRTGSPLILKFIPVANNRTTFFSRLYQWFSQQMRDLWNLHCVLHFKKQI